MEEQEKLVDTANQILNTIEAPKRVTSEQQIAIMLEAKRRVQNIVTGLKRLEKHVKKTKKSEKAMKVLEDFLKCNVTNAAIYAKYNKVVKMLGEYSNVHKN